jgi:hypothetical protein
MTDLNRSLVVGLPVLAKSDSRRIRLAAGRSKDLHQYPRIERQREKGVLHDR